MPKLTVREPFEVWNTFESLSRMLGENFNRTYFGVEEGALALDISQTDKEMIVRASVPGFRKEDIDVQVHNGVLSIKAERSEEEEIRNERYYRRERRAGSVSRRVALPGIVSETETDAELKDGVLTLRIPLSEQARPKQITIN